MDPKKMLQGKTAVITGGGRGIGRAIAKGFAREGAFVCITSRSEDELFSAVDEIRREGGSACSFVCDVTDLRGVEACFRFAAEEMKSIDILVVNAGINPEKTLVEESNPENWYRTIEVNLNGAYNCSRSVIPYMKKQKSGKIIMVGSGKGHRGSPLGSAYACSKAGLWMLTTVLAEEVEKYGIDVNELIPGPTVTSMNSGFGEKIDSVFTSGKEWVKQPEDVVPLAIFIASQPGKGPSYQSFSLARRQL